MRLPSSGELIGILATAIAVMNASGKGYLVWEAIEEMRRKATVELVKPWGCPSIFNNESCFVYNPKIYK